MLSTWASGTFVFFYLPSCFAKVVEAKRVLGRASSLPAGICC